MHTEFIAGAYLAHGPVTHNQHLPRIQPKLFLDLFEGGFLGKQVLPVRIKDPVNGRGAIQAEGSDFSFLNFGFPKADNKALYAATMQKAKERHGSGEKA